MGLLAAVARLHLPFFPCADCFCPALLVPIAWCSAIPCCNWMQVHNSPAAAVQAGAHQAVMSCIERVAQPWPEATSVANLQVVFLPLQGGHRLLGFSAVDAVNERILAAEASLTAGRMILNAAGGVLRMAMSRAASAVAVV